MAHCFGGIEGTQAQCSMLCFSLHVHASSQIAVAQSAAQVCVLRHKILFSRNSNCRQLLCATEVLNA